MSVSLAAVRSISARPEQIPVLACFIGEELRLATTLARKPSHPEVSQPQPRYQRQLSLNLLLSTQPATTSPVPPYEKTIQWRAAYCPLGHTIWSTYLLLTSMDVLQYLASEVLTVPLSESHVSVSISSSSPKLSKTVKDLRFCPIAR